MSCALQGGSLITGPKKLQEGHSSHRELQDQGREVRGGRFKEWWWSAVVDRIGTGRGQEPDIAKVMESWLRGLAFVLFSTGSPERV